MRRPRIPIAMPIIIVVLLILGFAAMQLIPRMVTPEQLARNVLVAAIPFVLIFVAILLTYITVIAAVASAINDLLKPRTYNIVINLITAGILLGIVGMFQAVSMQLYTRGFTLLFISTLLYILWSHISPAPHSDEAPISEAPEAAGAADV